jgi:hypothetical protein
VRDARYYSKIRDVCKIIILKLGKGLTLKLFCAKICLLKCGLRERYPSKNAKRESVVSTGRTKYYPSNTSCTQNYPSKALFPQKKYPSRMWVPEQLSF